MTGLLNSILNLHGLLVYLIVGGLVFLEDAIFVGFVLPGETAAILGGVVASQGHANVYVVCAVVVAAAILGDTVGYEVGRHFGTRLLGLKMLDKRRDQIDAASEFLARRGGPAVFFGRYVAFLRAVIPFLAGASRMPYRKFLLYNAAGGLTWGIANVLLGYLAGNSYRAIERTFGTAAAVVVAVLVLAAVIFWAVRRHRRQRRRAETAEQERDADADQDAGHL